MTTRICLIRHGETDWNREKRIQGRLDVDLNDRGRAQAAAIARSLAGRGIAAVYSSDLTRALQTAQTVAEGLGLPVRPEPGLRERDYGIFQGLTAAEAAARFPEAHARYVARDPDYDFGTGETLRGLSERIAETLGRIGARHPGESILAVAHGGVLDVVYRRATGRPLHTPRDFPVPNAALNWIEVGQDAWRVLEWADETPLDHPLEESVE